jgi:hypothetical protein
LLFPDVVGSLSAISSTLSERGIKILSMKAFTTSTGIAVDVVEVAWLDLAA